LEKKSVLHQLEIAPNYKIWWGNPYLTNRFYKKS